MNLKISTVKTTQAHYISFLIDYTRCSCHMSTVIEIQVKTQVWKMTRKIELSHKSVYYTKSAHLAHAVPVCMSHKICITWSTCYFHSLALKSGNLIRHLPNSIVKIYHFRKRGKVSHKSSYMFLKC